METLLSPSLSFSLALRRPFRLFALCTLALFGNRAHGPIIGKSASSTSDVAHAPAHSKFKLLSNIQPVGPPDDARCVCAFITRSPSVPPPVRAAVVARFAPISKGEFLESDRTRCVRARARAHMNALRDRRAALRAANIESVLLEMSLDGVIAEFAG